MSLITRLAAYLALAGAAWSQVAAPAFEVATIKRSDPTAEEGQMIRDPRLVALAHVSVQNLLAQAYRIKNFQISGPGWLDSDRLISSQGFLTEPPRISFRGCSKHC